MRQKRASICRYASGRSTAVRSAVEISWLVNRGGRRTRPECIMSRSTTPSSLTSSCAWRPLQGRDCYYRSLPSRGGRFSRCSTPCRSRRTSACNTTRPMRSSAGSTDCLPREVKTPRRDDARSDRYLVPGRSWPRSAADARSATRTTQARRTGQGTNDYDSIFRILRSVNFSGWLSVEYGMDGLDRTRAVVRVPEEERRSTTDLSAVCH